jgi:hypothetical protein
MKTQERRLFRLWLSQTFGTYRDFATAIVLGLSIATLIVKGVYALAEIVFK